MSTVKNKVRQAETKIFLRSEIHPATYNARKISPEARKELKANIKANGLLGGVLINIRTGNIVSGHQRVDVIDEINHYKEGKTDYEFRSEFVDVDDKTEKEMNIALNSRKLQGEYDYAKLAKMIPEIDIDLAGLDAVDLSMVEVETPKDFHIDIPTFEPQTEKIEKLKEKEELSEEEKEAKKEHVKSVKEAVKNAAVYEGDPYFTVSFDTYENKVFFLERFSISGDTKFIKGEEFADLIDNG